MWKRKKSTSKKKGMLLLLFAQESTQNKNPLSTCATADPSANLANFPDEISSFLWEKYNIVFFI